ncbi:spore germination protein [Ornithinibacillus halotolerans]|uniref:Spore germination protein n=1 Tax=Ornithinibacillus halotolerans TaxID=1274357 RepID=A0A916S6E6_9BACI|nr:spore germination protein [Ornithinibacillus halotolerans]GGA85798.1 spore germination protein [Ornithinibacillus halotolerans]
MWGKKSNKKQDTKGTSIFPIKIDTLEQILADKFEKNPDLKFSKYKVANKKVAVFFIDYQIDMPMFQHALMDPLINFEKNNKPFSYESLLNELPLNSGGLVDDLDTVLSELIIGKVFIYIESEKSILGYLMPMKESRSVEKAETESLVLGPKISFTESLSKNLNIVRWLIKSTDLVMEEFKVGKVSPKDVRLIYLKSLANDDDVQTMRQRLKELDVDQVEDAIVLKQYLEDSQLNIFPQFDATERPDRFVYNIVSGKLGVLVENSPSGFTAPATLFSFLESTEDLYMRWQGGTFFRLLRFFAMFFSIIITPTYVAAVTYQYAIIPIQLLISIGQSRAAVPFPPVFEVLLLEFMLELLREAGARLPTKVGQTMGIVGGIVIGQAAVEAGLTSNILIILVAMSALASFVTPSYLFGTSIRLIRFPLILLASIFGLLGIVFGITFLIIHATRLTSLGRPYLVPLYPLHIKDFNKVFVRTPFNYTSKLAKSYRPKILKRYNKEDAKKIRDIDE